MESKTFGKALLYGLITIFFFAMVSSIIFSLILRFTSVQEGSLHYIVTAISFVGIFGGGFISGGKGKHKGWLIGGVTGTAYSFIILLFQYLGYDELFSTEQVIYHVCYILICMMGGILGVNMNSNTRNSI
ncbi:MULTISPECIES: TIGR04086 family membrane protein [unclassified Bacillus (in: firmicutes)]|uniref:TIGR04086 family membrane protein n=1 Tax=unclassified Bacillus (in: firmicutes) TaxID=185979 RepID=UPI0008E353C2|nr:MULTISPECIES: TIGR04086 family membrane protein [unclassified Bacillus (in: firmicutes)]SFQ78504.1 putative membrane protein, TIGR04086 family [Bacillus sp. cl95]